MWVYVEEMQVPLYCRQRKRQKTRKVQLETLSARMEVVEEKGRTPIRGEAGQTTGFYQRIATKKKEKKKKAGVSKQQKVVWVGW